MHRLLCFFLLIPALLSCAGVAERVRLAKFDSTFEVYDITLRRSQFRAAADFIDPAVRDEKIDYKIYDNIKVVDFKVTHLKVSEDRFNVEQVVALQYFLLDRNVLKTIEYRQLWNFDEAKGVWLLRTPLPTFDH